jgi:hypothetical protein
LQVTVERPRGSAGVRDLFKPTADDPPEAG